MMQTYVWPQVDRFALSNERTDLALAFDLDDTLYRYRVLFPAWEAAMREVLGVGGGELGWAAYSDLKVSGEHFSRSSYAQHLRAWLRAEQSLSPDEVARRAGELVAAIQRSVDEAGAEPLVEGAGDMLQAAGARGIPRVVVTKGESEWQTEKARAAGILDVVELFVVTDTNPEKADVCAWLRETASELWFVDDTWAVHESVRARGLQNVRHFLMRSDRTPEVPDEAKGGYTLLKEWYTFTSLLTNHLA